MIAVHESPKQRNSFPNASGASERLPHLCQDRLDPVQVLHCAHVLGRQRYETLVADVLPVGVLEYKDQETRNQIFNLYYSRLVNLLYLMY